MDINKYLKEGKKATDLYRLRFGLLFSVQFGCSKLGGGKSSNVNK